jgi:lipopolysaccharide export system permease protein
VQFNRLAAVPWCAMNSRHLRLSLLDRYIFKSVFFTCAAAVGLFTFIVIVPNVARDLLPYVLGGQLPGTMFGRLVLLLLPYAITYALPMGMLTGVLLTLGRLSADSEITAMRAAGVSMMRITRPVLLLAVLGAVIALYFNFESMPSTRVKYKRDFAAAVRSNPLSIVVPKTFIREFPGYVVYVGEKEGGEMSDFWLWELDKDRRVRRVVRAQSGNFDYDEATNSLVLTLSQAQVETRDEKNPEEFTEAQLVGSFERSEPFHLSLDNFFGRAGTTRMKQEWLTYSQLRAARTSLAQEPTPADPAAAEKLELDRMKLELVYHDKFNTALAVLSLALIGVPLGIKVSRRETSANFAVAVGLTLTYYVMTLAVKVLDRHPEFRPDLLLWVPNIVLLSLGIWLLTRIDKR